MVRTAIPRLLRSVLWAAPAGASAMVALRSYVGRYNGNIRLVDGNQVHRSGQLTGPRLQRLLTSKGIKSVVNLRGSLDDAALREEREICQQLGVTHVDIDWDLGRLPQPKIMRELLHALDQLPRPLLIHCAAGSDRTGLACTLYLHLHKGLSLRQAQWSQLTWRYGHWPLKEAKLMERFLNLYRETGRGLPLRAWITEEYPCIYEAEQLNGKRRRARSLLSR